MGEGFKNWFAKTSSSLKRPSLHAKESDSPVDLHSEVVVLVDDHSRKEALSDEAALSKSVSPTIDARSLQVQQFVRALFLSHGQLVISLLPR
ncbi:hypothetical protein QQP08_017394 [Theobroma cacao]|nr:hypothetical protein QQP08_017394 [Theobroma cacao]